VFGIVLISISTLMHLYVFWRAWSVPLVAGRVPGKVIITVALILWLLLYLGRTIGHDAAGTPARVLELLGMCWLGVLLLTFVPMFAVDLVTGFGWFLPRLAPSLRGWALVAAGVLSAMALFQGLRPPVIQSYEVVLPGLPQERDGTVIVGLSDTHIGSLIGKRWLSARVVQVRAQQPDMVVLLGDIFEGHGPPHADLLPTLRGLAPPLGVWAVPGNHEHHRDDTGLKAMEEAGFHLLRNRWAEVQPGLVLAGVDDLTFRRRRGLGGDPVGQALAGRPQGAVVLLSHTPWEADRAARSGVGLMLSGHTHGGQIWPMGYLVRLRYPLLAGHYEVEGMPVIVCRGTGTWGPRMRLWRPGEILRVTLKAGKGP